MIDLEQLLTYTIDSNGIDAILANTPVDGLEITSEIMSLYGDIGRLEQNLSMANQNPRKYAPIIARYNLQIADKRRRLAELASPASGDGKPPRQPSGFSTRDDYQKEKSDLVKYFSKDAVSSVLKTEQDMTYAAMGVRLLNSMGKLLDNYEINVPADYRLELLKRSGRFCEEANVFQRIQEGGIQLFRPRERIEGGFIFRVTNSEPQMIFETGFDRSSGDFSEMYTHVYDYDFKERDGYVSTIQSLAAIKDIWFKPKKEGGFGFTREQLEKKPLYVYVINPRAFLGIDIETSAETFSKLIPEFDSIGDRTYDFAFKQREVALLGSVDSRDIRHVFKLEYGGKDIALTNMQKNEKYIMSSWELPGT